MKLHLPKLFLQVLAIVSLSFVVSTHTPANGQAGGGTVTSGAASKPSTKTTKTTTPTATTPKAKPPTKPTAARPTGGAANIDGRWWTTGNDFGAGEVVFTQSGVNVTGIIKWSDGRTGSLTGKIVGKRLHHSFTTAAGDGGAGWLELSWNNFLGGSWKNQRVKDGSWTLNRIEGNWCFGGSRSRIRRVTHDAAGRVSMVTEDGTQEEGHLDGPYIFLHSDMGNIRGDMDFRANRMNWSTGFYWTWCGRFPPA